MTTLFTVPIPNTGGVIACTSPRTEKEHGNIYLLTFTSPKDNRLTPAFIEALLLALDIIEHRYPKGVIITTSGIAKFYSNGLDLDIVGKTENFLENWLWPLFRRFLTTVNPGPYLTIVLSNKGTRYPMPTVCLLNGHAFAGGFMLAMYHDYRVMNPDRGFLCVNELEFGASLHKPMMSIFREKLGPNVFRDVVLEARRWGGRDAFRAGIVNAVGGIEEVLGLIRDRKLQTKALTGVYGTMKSDMYTRTLSALEDHAGNLLQRETWTSKTRVVQQKGLEAVEAYERMRNSRI